MRRDDIQYFFDLGLQRCRWDDYDYSILKRVPVDQTRGNAKKRQNNCFIMLDTETSKSGPDVYTVDDFGRKQYKINHNYIVAWSLAISVYGFDIALITGSRPSECTECLNRIADSLPGNLTPVYVHSLTYDVTFLRKFLFRDLGYPVKQLNTKPHYPIIMEFGNGIQLRDSLILAQCKLEKWAEDMHVEHQKAVGSWDYDRIRNQGDELSEEEQKAERKDFYRVFFWANVFNPRAEVQKFIRHNERHSWRATTTKTVFATPSERKALAEEWAANEKCRKARAPDFFLNMWWQLWHRVENEHPELEPAILDPRNDFKLIQEIQTAVFYCHKQIRMYFEEDPSGQAFLKEVLPGYKIEFSKTPLKK